MRYGFRSCKVAIYIAIISWVMHSARFYLHVYSNVLNCIWLLFIHSVYIINVYTYYVDRLGLNM